MVVVLVVLVVCALVSRVRINTVRDIIGVQTESEQNEKGVFGQKDAPVVSGLHACSRNVVAVFAWAVLGEAVLARWASVARGDVHGSSWIDKVTLCGLQARGAFCRAVDTGPQRLIIMPVPCQKQIYSKLFQNRRHVPHEVVRRSVKLSCALTRLCSSTRPRDGIALLLKEARRCCVAIAKVLCIGGRVVL